MSHRSDCPDRWTAEREGERAQEYGRGRYSNPYSDPIDGCEEGARAWSDGYRRAEYREEERREEEAAEQRRAERRHEEEAEYDYYAYQQQPEEPFPEEPMPEPPTPQDEGMERR